MTLDNHHDFGGHAKPKEFHHRGRTLLTIVGSINVDTPSDWSDITKPVSKEKLLETLDHSVAAGQHNLRF